ncbi:MAG: hypothetical protein DMF61_09235 [Blastocatellia bacterium AA13]|nr:MAG: hypothetical protein DMF61_09235 [Blastocatellia bacterium AA13]
MGSSVHRIAIALAFIACILANAVEAQTKYSRKSTAKSYPNAQEKKKKHEELAEKLSTARHDLVQATNDYKASLEKLLPLYNADLKNAAELVKKRSELYAQGIISRRELEDTRRAVATAQQKVDELNKQLGEANDVVAEVEAAEKLLKEQSGAGGNYTTSALIRFNGTGEWALSLASKVETFFAAKYNHQLPISAFGQTAVHNHLGFDHHNAMDVAVHPDSAEGQGLMAYLRALGIPFIAFRSAVPGSATGAHIHIGLPSHRIAPIN